MAKVIKLSLGLLGLSQAQQPRADVEQAFEAFIQKFGKKYQDDVEKGVRFEAFVKNYDYINAENAKDNTYKLGLNEFSDMSLDEFQLNKLGLSTGNKWGNVPSLGMHKVSNTSLPSSVDWTSKNAVTPVKNQGQCGSCWAFSTTGALEGAWALATGHLVSLSEQQLVDCSAKFGNQGCQGGLMDNGFKYEEQAAVCTEDSYSYTGHSGICKAQACKVGIPEGAVTGYKDVAADDEQALMDAVAQQPVSVAIEADQMAFQLYKSGVLSKTCGTKLDHGVLVVGYGTEGGTDYWLVKNSWGPSWGLQGYVKVERGMKGPGECGIKSQPSYPVVKAGPVPPSPPSPPSPPAPPAPPAPPSPPSPPAASHYEKPPCQSDEVEASVQGAGGEVCAPKCNNGACPTDTPAGTRAKPSCILQDSSSGEKYCALTCFLDSGCPSGAKCAKQGFLGICVYPDSSSSSRVFTMADQATEVVV